MVTVKIPATSANLGSGFDTIGIALQIYNTVAAEEIEEGLVIDILDESSQYLPHDTRNLVYRAMKAVFERTGHDVKGLHIIQNNSIPVTRGLGSSSSSIVGGLIAANEICGRRLTKDQLITLATQIEGHPDNITPAITGGMAIAVKGEQTYYLSVPVNEDKLRFAVFVPNFTLRTKKARSVLPRTISHSDGVFNTSRAALLVASMITENYDNLKIALQDRLHQPYRRKLIDGVDIIFKKSSDFGALGAYISGAGPTVIAILKAENASQFDENMQKFLEGSMPKWKMQIIKPDNYGAQIVEGGN